jgi:hypothetical protein
LLLYLTSQRKNDCSPTIHKLDGRNGYIRKSNDGGFRADGWYMWGGRKEKKQGIVRNLAWLPIEVASSTVALVRQASHLPHEIVHRVLHHLELGHPAPLALDVLTQPAQSGEVQAACVQRADVYLVLVARAGEVLVQRGERTVLPMAQVAFVRGPVPRRSRRFVSDVRAAAGEKARGVGDYVLSVVLTHIAVDGLAVRARGASPRLKVENER